jgi:hypothetical protein
VIICRCCKGPKTCVCVSFNQLHKSRIKIETTKVRKIKDCDMLRTVCISGKKCAFYLQNNGNLIKRPILGP